MDSRLTKEASVKGLGDVYFIDAPYDQALEALGNLRQISAHDLADARIQKGVEHSVSQNGSYVSEGVLFVPQKGVCLTRGSIVNSHATEATNAHRQGKEFYLDEKTAQEFIEQQGKGALWLKNTNPVPTDRFGEDELAVFVFQDKAEKYGNFLNEAGIKAMPLYFRDAGYINEQKKPFANQLWLHRLGGDSELDGNWGLDCDDGVRGVQEVTGEASTQTTEPSARSITPYTKKQMDSMLSILERVKEGKLPNSKLERVIELLSKGRKD